VNWIITSLLDTDLYKFTMSYLYYRRFPDVQGEFVFTCRNADAAIADLIGQAELVRQLEHVRALSFTSGQLAFLDGLGYFRDRTYLDFLAQIELPKVSVRPVGRGYDIRVKGPLAVVTFWEIWVLAIINCLLAESNLQRLGLTVADVQAEGRRRLNAKIEQFARHPDLRITDFGTRRRWNFHWQLEMLQTAQRALPEQFVATSNVDLGRRLNLPVVGTFAHEEDMAYAGIYGTTDEKLRHSHQIMLHDWWEEFGGNLSIALTDTYGTDFFFSDFTAEQARSWQGLRQDSGDPFAFGDKAIAFYRHHGIDPRHKTIIFSDGLDHNLIIALHNRFVHTHGRQLKDAYGYGTNFTFDVGLPTYSLVMKLEAIFTDGRQTPVAKLSDNWAKAIGHPKAIERTKRVFGYQQAFTRPVNV
jgi:nicotinate phosphoribosyltransferase